MDDKFPVSGIQVLRGMFCLFNPVNSLWRLILESQAGKVGKFVALVAGCSRFSLPSPLRTAPVWAQFVPFPGFSQKQWRGMSHKFTPRLAGAVRSPEGRNQQRNPGGTRRSPRTGSNGFAGVDFVVPHVATRSAVEKDARPLQDTGLRDDAGADDGGRGDSLFREVSQRFPDPQGLAVAEEAEVLKAWEGLGYYRRARQLQAAARMIVEEHRGRFPGSRGGPGPPGSRPVHGRGDPLLRL